MPTVTPSTCVTARHASDPNNVPCVIADRGMSDLHMCRWFNGRILVCHAGDPGSIPGRCRLYQNSCTVGCLFKIPLMKPADVNTYGQQTYSLIKPIFRRPIAV